MINDNRRLSSVLGWLCESALRTLVMLTLGLGLLVAAWWSATTIYALDWPRGHHALPDIAAITAAVAGIVLSIYIARRAAPYPPVCFLAIAGIGSLALRAIYHLQVELPFVSDFGLYWKAASILAAQDDYDVMGSLYLERALPFLLPLVEVFGDETAALEVMNSFVLLGTMLLGYDLLRRAVNHQAAQAFSLIWILAPEPFLSSAVPSHDLIGSALYALGFWTISHAVLSTDWKRPGIFHVMAGCFLGVVLMLAELARGTDSGLFFVFCTLLLAIVLAVARIKKSMSVFSWSSPVTGIVIQLLFAVPVMLLLISAAVRMDLATDPAKHAAFKARVTLPHATAMSDGTYRFLRRYHDNMNADMMETPDIFQMHSRAVTLSELAQRPGERLWSSAERLPRLFRLGSRFDLYLPKGSNQGEAFRRGAVLYSLGFAFIFSVALFASLLKFVKVPIDAVPLHQLLALCGMVLVLILFRENSPRYMYPIWFSGCLLIGYFQANRAPATRPLS